MKTPTDDALETARAARALGDDPLSMCKILPVGPAEASFVRSSLANSMRQSDLGRPLDNATYWDLLVPTVAAIVMSGTCVWLESPDGSIVSWASAKDGVLLYVYTKEIFRRQGAAEKLLTHLGIGGYEIKHAFRGSNVHRIIAASSRTFTYVPTIRLVPEVI